MAGGGGGVPVFLQMVQPLLRGGGEGVHFFSREKNRGVYSRDWRGIIGGFLACWWGCGGTIAEGGRGSAAGLLRMNRHHGNITDKLTFTAFCCFCYKQQPMSFITE